MDKDNLDFSLELPKTKRQIASEPKVKTFICEQCGTQFTRKANHAKYCEDCAKQRQLDRARAYQENKKNLKVRHLRTKDICIECGKEYIVRSGAQKVCDECRKKHAYIMKAEKNSEYIARAYDTTTLRMKKGDKDKLKQKLAEYSQLIGDTLSMNDFILQAIALREAELDKEIEELRQMPF